MLFLHATPYLPPPTRHPLTCCFPTCTQVSQEMFMFIALVAISGTALLSNLYTIFTSPEHQRASKWLHVALLPYHAVACAACAAGILLNQNEGPQMAAGFMSRWE